MESLKRICFLAVVLSCFCSAISLAQSLKSLTQQLDSAWIVSKSAPESAFAVASELLEKSRSSKMDSLTARIQLLRGKILFQFGMFQEATEALYEAEYIFERDLQMKRLAQVNNVLGEVYYRIKNSENALQRHEQALKIYNQIQDEAGEAETKSYIGGMFEKMGSYPKALEYQTESLSLFESLGMKSEIAFVRENIGSIYEDLEKYDSAYSNFQKAFLLNSELGDSLRLIGNLNNLGDVLRKTGDAEKSLEFSQKAAEMSQRLGVLNLQKSAVVDISKAYAEMGDYENAFEYLEQSRQLSDLVFTEESTRQLAIQEAQYNLFTKNQQIKELEQTRIFDAKVKWLLLFLVSLLCVLSWVIFNRQKLKIRSNRELLQRQDEILEVKEQLINTEKENLKLLELKMQAEDKAHSRSLTAQTLHVIDKNQMLEDIQTKLKSILEEDPKEQKKRIRNLIKQIDFNFSHDTDWDDFKHTFEKVHQDFFKNIQARSGGLTPAEMKLASLMRLNLNSKEIASSLGISMDSLRISRYRLRKKLNLKKDDSLQQFLLCI
ncbi:Tetratricopeptide repeat-containing protein [Algoriphagus locisalis]|uniref:Tetratricopeptide repeat-containing protein n=1 Tax=Algoriphagus locisalis TaxID=305507 RepID=A0A1I6ZU82_9BACT|nr:tetratricopeptide repeat protein [Algoriphagus locisalis]SFT66248.1 Tetratricopeptide repeat-containing protein [Algoriphagus locisalis]